MYAHVILRGIAQYSCSWARCCDSELKKIGEQVEQVLGNQIRNSAEKVLFRANLHAFCRAAGKHPTRGAAVPHTIEL